MKQNKIKYIASNFPICISYYTYECSIPTPLNFSILIFKMAADEIALNILKKVYRKRKLKLTLGNQILANH